MRILVLKNQIEVELSNLPSPLISALKRMCIFPNPKYFELQRLMFSTYKTPKIIFCGEIGSEKLIIPRGILEQCYETIRNAGGQIKLIDKRKEDSKFKISFKGKLYTEQKKALNELIKYEVGVLVAEPGSGKTVIACAVINKRKLPTLIVVHRTPLLEQWQKRIEEYLNIDHSSIGIIGGYKKKPKNKIDIAMLQTLSKMDNLEQLLSIYSQIIVDECHHIAAFSFEEILKKAPAKYILGLTATPFRKDGHHPIIHMQCGPVRYEMSHTASKHLEKKVYIKETGFKLIEESSLQLPIHIIWDYIVHDKDRNELISKDIIEELENNRFPLIISERKEHLVNIMETLKPIIKDNISIFVLDGDLGKKARRNIFNSIEELASKNEQFCLLTTSSLIGEGFDLPVLDTLFLTMPIAFKGRIIQYTGRLHRKNDGKDDVKVVDYVDSFIPVALSMYKKRRATYKKIGYQMYAPEKLDWKKVSKK